MPILFSIFSLSLTMISFASAECLNINKSVTKTSPAKEVTVIHKYLYSENYLPAFPKNGKYGPSTVAAVTKFQKDNKLKITGIVDLATRSKIKEKSCLLVTEDKVTSTEKAGKKFVNSSAINVDNNSEYTSVSKVITSIKSKQCVFDYIKEDDRKVLILFAANGNALMIRDYFDDGASTATKSFYQYIIGDMVHVISKHNNSSVATSSKNDFESAQTNALNSIIKSGDYNTPAFSLTENLNFVCKDWKDDGIKLKLPKDTLQN